MFQICLDNVDTHVSVHDMTEENQNIDTHECALGFVPNRTSDYGLSSDAPKVPVPKLDNAVFLCSKKDRMEQRLNYIDLVERVITKDIRCLEMFSEIVTKQIPHKYSKAMWEKCEMVRK